MQGRVWLPLAMMVCAVMGCSASSTRLESDLPPFDPAGRSMAMEPHARIRAAATVIGHSLKGEPIEMHEFAGNPDDAVLVIGGIHGNEQTSVDVARELVTLLESQPGAALGRHVAVIVNANPDGYRMNRRTNARGIDLNRNFAAANFRRSRRGVNSGGAEPLSEPESRAIASTIQRLRPTLLISIHSIERGRHCNNYDGPAKHIAEAMSARNGYPAKESIGYPTPGSLGSWAGQDLQIPMITLELPRDIDGKQAWRENREAILAAFVVKL